MARGGWADPGVVNQLLTAISFVHRRHGHVNAYMEPCAACVTAWIGNSDSHGCPHHFGNRHVHRTGNPRFDGQLRGFVRQHHQANQGYAPIGDSPLTPSELLAVRQALLGDAGGDDRCAFQTWVMILVGVSLFLRAEKELCGITVVPWHIRIRLDLSDNTCKLFGIG